jgi:coronatine-insensitive protein 1
MLANVSWRQVLNVIGNEGLGCGCAKLRYLALYVCDITNVALAMVGQGCLHLINYRIVFGERVNFANFPLDDGVKLLL